MRRACTVVFIALAAATGLWAQPLPKRAPFQVAQLALPTGAEADWRQWDSFLTAVIKKVAQDLGQERREQLRDLFLDSRYELVLLSSAGTSDAVSRLFLDTWNRLSPILKESLGALPPETADQYRGFIAAMDSAASLGGLSQTLGLFRITPDTLRAATGLLGISDADPLAYTLDVDSALRELLGFDDPLPPPRVSPSLEQGSLPGLRFSMSGKAAAGLRSWIVPSAFAADDDFDRLNQWVPESAELEEYLIEVHKLLVQAGERSKSKLAAEHHSLYRQVIFTAAWQESCWRQFIKKGKKLVPLASATGDVGMMQVNRNTWRGLYDLKGLAGDIEYNSYAGSEILLYYMNRFALAKREDKQPGGHLARATYSAYNGGPGQLTRYRNAKTSAALKEVDDAFWTKFQIVSGGQELAVKSCYSG
jgi:Transglycosylase SLT domain